MVFNVDWVLVDELALGPCPKNQESLDVLSDLKIKVVLSLCSEEECRLPKDIEEKFKCYRYILPDHKYGRCPTEKELLSTLELIRKIKQFGPLFVHCVASIERSPLVSMAWLIKEHNLSAESALEYLRDIHPITNPFPEQFSILKKIF